MLNYDLKPKKDLKEELRVIFSAALEVESEQELSLESVLQAMTIVETKKLRYELKDLRYEVDSIKEQLVKLQETADFIDSAIRTQ